MERPMLLLAFCLCIGGTYAQDSSLTRDFDKLSAKERSRIAKKEAEESAEDVKFQALMKEAEELFRSRRYEDALDRYTQARVMRPYNVYPKVKIQDLEALIAKREAEEREEQLKQERALVEERREAGSGAVVPALEHSDTVKTPHETVNVLPAPGTKVETPSKVQQVDVTPVRTSLPTVKAEAERSPKATVQPKEVVPSPPAQDGVQERVYKEGRAVVLERQVTKGGQIAVYRRVTHPYGDAVHFKDGVAIPDRTWNEVFGD